MAGHLAVGVGVGKGDGGSVGRDVGALFGTPDGTLVGWDVGVAVAPQRAARAAQAAKARAKGIDPALRGLAVETGIGEDVRVAAYHLVGDLAGDRVEIELPVLLGHAGMKDDLQQQIAQLFAKPRHIAGFDRVGDFVGFLDRVGRDRGKGLLDIPSASGFRVAKLRHDIEQAGQLGGHGAVSIGIVGEEGPYHRCRML